MRRQSGMISVVRRKLITSDESFLTSAPMTPRDVRRRYSKGGDLEVVLSSGYRKSGICAASSQQNLRGVQGSNLPFKKSARVSLCEATHCSKARALHTRFDAAAVS